MVNGVDTQKLFPLIKVHQYGAKKRVMDMNMFVKYFLDGKPLKKLTDGKYCEKLLLHFVNFLLQHKLMPQGLETHFNGYTPISFSGDPAFFDKAYCQNEVGFEVKEKLRACFTRKCPRLSCDNSDEARETQCGINNLSLLLVQAKCRVMNKTWYNTVGLSECKQVGGKSARWVLDTHPEIKHFGIVTNAVAELDVDAISRGTFGIDGEIFYSIFASFRARPDLLKLLQLDLQVHFKPFVELHHEVSIAEYSSTAPTITETVLEKEQVKFDVCSEVYELYKEFNDEQKQSLLAVVEDAIPKISIVAGLAKEGVDLQDAYAILFPKKRKL